MLQQLYRIVSGRVTRNIFFWVFIYYIKLSDADSLTAYPKGYYYSLMLVLLGFFIVLCYVNNLLLVPRLLARQRYGRYLLTVGLFIFLVAFTYTWALKLILATLPGIDVFQVSVLSAVLTPDTSVLSVLGEMSDIFVIMVVWVFVFTALWFMHDYARKEKLVEEALKKQAEAELGFLKSQLNPHFLFNTLNNLYGLALKRSDETPEVILKLSAILRYTLYESNAALVPFEKEKEIMQAYIDIEMLRLQEKAHAHFSIMSDGPRQVPPLLWLPVLENLFKHGMRMNDAQARIDFRYTIHGRELTIFSQNRLAALPGQQHEAGGIGLDNLRKRLQLLYPSSHSVMAAPDESHTHYLTQVLVTL